MADEKAISLGNLTVFKEKIDNEIAEVEGKIPVIPESLPANGGKADKLKSFYVGSHETGSPRYYKFAEMSGKGNNDEVLSLKILDGITTIEPHYGILDIIFRPSNIAKPIQLQWEIVNSYETILDKFIAIYKNDENGNYVAECYFKSSTIYDQVWISEITETTYVKSNTNLITLVETKDPNGLEKLPEGYNEIHSTIMPLLNDKELEAELADLKAYIGYTDGDIYGLEADFENNRFTRLAGAVGKNPGADFDSMNAFGGRKRCNVSSDGTVYAYYGDGNFDYDGVVGNERYQIMVEQPKFYYKVVPLKTEKIDGADGYHLRKARYYISDTPKPGFKVHPAFVQNGVEVDKIYLSAYEGSIRDISANSYLGGDEQIADFDRDIFCSVPDKKPASGTTQELTIANARKLAQNRGAGWGITNIQTFSMSQLLFIIEYGGFNSQTLLGAGASDLDHRTGDTSLLGNLSGTNNSTISYRGEEDLWGGKWMFCDNVDTIAAENESYTNFNISGEKSSLYAPVLTNAAYISAVSYDPLYDWAFIASEALGSSALPVGDHFQNNTSGEAQWIISGHGSGNDSGLFAQGVFAATAHWESLGARLIYIPQTTAQEVTAND